MKRTFLQIQLALFFTLASLFISSSLMAQVPQKISYQALIRDASNVLVASEVIGMQFSILQGSASGSAVYVETQSPTSNENGVISLEIGTGSVVSGDFAVIDWSTGNYFIKSEIDPAGGTNYTITVTNQLLSVPYALYAEKSGNVPDGTTAGEMNYWNGTAWVTVSTGTTGQTLTLCDVVPTWGPCTASLAIGDYHQGGIVAYILQPGDARYDASVQHGIIAAPIDQSASAPWYNGAYITTGSMATFLGSGNINTTSIVVNQGAGSYAAQLCYDLVLDGYSDWYLPGKDELNHLYENRTVIGGFAGANYWSSSEDNVNIQAWEQSFLTGVQGYPNKNSLYRVRAIRGF